MVRRLTHYTATAWYATLASALDGDTVPKTGHPGMFSGTVLEFSDWTPI